MSNPLWRKLAYPIGGVAVVGALFSAYQHGGRSSDLVTGDDAARKVYVAPGQKDEFYAMLSGGFNGQMSVYGLPSGRLLKIIPVFAQHAENGWGYSEETKPMLNTSYGFIPWDDAHHPELSQTDGVPDGRWVFINANNTPRVARIDLSTMETTEILEIPNSAGNHPSPFTTPDTRYVVAATRFSVPIPQRDVSIEEFEHFKGTISFIRADQPGRMDVAFQLLVPGVDYDKAHVGKGVSDGWAFFTSYDTELAHTLLEKNASQNDKDFVAAVNWKRAEECVAQGKARTVPANYAHNVLDERSRVAHSSFNHSVKMLRPDACPGVMYYLPTPKSPHGVDVDPSGEYIVSGGKLSTIIPVHSFTKIRKAIESRAFDGTFEGIPVLKYDAIIAGEVKNPGLGPLHTEFDGKGYAYTSNFISSDIVKWKLGTWEVVDKIPTYYSTGHLMIPGGDSRKPWGKYLVALNKITKDRYLPTGPELAQSAQLIDISGDKMKLLLDFPTTGEPHYAQALPAALVTAHQVKYYDLHRSTHPYRVTSEAETKAVRTGNRVDVYMAAIRSHFAPDNIEGIRVGDSVYFHVTNLEQDWDIPHGFAAMGNRNGELLVMPGETRTLAWVPQEPGVYPFYCTDFCSALHQEMQGYARVSPKGSDTPLAWGTDRPLHPEEHASHEEHDRHAER
ncbi:MAG TPA: Sec-dependent nitrous-oxide reductase [Longimicrobiaceae bacterium]|nr:Sec-dependent nitrous-oxide reductase [Longimicrobiaceae bacterium]